MNNTALLAIGVGAIAAVAVLTSRKKTNTTTVTLDPSQIRARSPGINPTRANFPIQPINMYQPPGKNYAEQVAYCWAHAGTPDIARNCITWMQSNGYPDLASYQYAADY